ncbi:Cytochrome c oxidase subunit 5B, mitochondrial [Microbotryomycetes sp. JL201]|nr:Cytochrome c oxidase subunit 5B, mitochondrial [Microbotryomycetes sp. JL201]
MSLRQLTSTAVRHARQSGVRLQSSVAPAAGVSLSNIEASWKGLTPQEQEQTFKHLEELQKKDWKELSLDEKKAAYYVAFGPHGPREPILPPGSGAKTAGGVAVAVAVAGVVFYGLRSFAQEKPKTLTKEWQEASNEKAREENLDPFTGPNSKDYKGKGFVSTA